MHWKIHFVSLEPAGCYPGLSPFTHGHHYLVYKPAWLRADWQDLHANPKSVHDVVFCFDLLRMAGKKWRATQWTFVWILSAVKNIPPMKEIIIRIGGEIREIPQILVERDLWKSSPNAMRDQSTCSCPVLFQTIYKYAEYCRWSTLHNKQLGMKDLVCTLSPFRKSKKKRSRSSSSSSSSSSKSQKEDVAHDKSDPKDKGFNRARLGQRESPGSAERGRPRGGFVSLSNDVGLMEENSCVKMNCVLDFHSLLCSSELLLFNSLSFSL